MDRGAWLATVHRLQRIRDDSDLAHTHRIFLCNEKNKAPEVRMILIEAGGLARSC